MAQAEFAKAGFTNVIHVEGGTLACVAAGLPAVQGKKAKPWKRYLGIAAALVLIGVLLGLLGRRLGQAGAQGVSVSTSDGVTTITVNGQTIVLKETEREVLGKTFQTGVAPRVVVEVFNGNITVEAVADKTVEVEVTKTALGETQEDAQANLDKIDVQLEQDGDTIRIAARRSYPGQTDSPQGLEEIKNQYSARSADASLKVPAGTALELRTSFGDVKVTDIAGVVDAKSASGRIAVSGGTGALQLASDFGDVTVDGQNSDVAITTKSGRVTVKGARGPLDVSSGFGTVEIDGALGKVVAHSDSGDIKVQHAKGAVELTSGFGGVTVEGAGSVQAETKSGRVTIKGATGPVRAKSGFGRLTVEDAPDGATLETSSGDIRLKGGMRAVSLTTGFGQIDAEVAEATVDASSKSGSVKVQGTLADGEHRLHSDFGAITLMLPPDSQFKLDAQTRFGRVQTDFSVTPVGESTDKHLEGSVGDQPQSVLTLTTSSGDIHLRKQ